MRIGVNTRFLLSSKMEGFGWYTFEVVKRMVENHPEHEFIFFFDRPFDPKFIFAQNVTPVVIFPPARHPFLFIWWFNFSIKHAIKKYQIDVFFSPDGYLSLHTKTPQVAVIHDLNFEHHPEDIPAIPRWYLRRYFPEFAKKASKIITVSNYSKQDIARTYGIDSEKITVSWNGATEAFKPLDTAEIATTRKTIGNGKPYFLFVGAIHPRKNVKSLITAFTQFAAQNSEIDLVIVGENLWKNGSSNIPKADTHIAQRIHFTGHVSLEKLTKIMGAAHVFMYLPYFEGFGIPLVEAMRCGIPIIAGNRTSLPEVAGDAALYTDPFDIISIVSHMEELTEINDTYLRLQRKGLERSALFSWHKTALDVWNVIEKVHRETKLL